MVVLSLTDCPPSLRGDLTKWLCEINTGVYVGNLNAKVRDALWNRVCENIGDGRATLVYSSNTEQGYVFRVHNTNWEAVDYEGVTFMRKPLPDHQEDEADQLKPGFSNVSKHRMAKRLSQGKGRGSEEYIVLDLETTGLDPQKDQIVEIGLLKVKQGTVADSYSALILQGHPLEKSIVELTGITDDEINEKGVSIKEALNKITDLIGTDVIYGYNIGFDCAFLQTAFERCKLDNPIRRTKDIFVLARKKIDEIDNYKLETVAEQLGIEINKHHRALPDCDLAFRILTKLNEM